MRYILLFLIGWLCFSGSVSAQPQNAKLPEPTRDFLAKNEDNSQKEIAYFKQYFGKGERRILKRGRYSNDVCASVYTFRTGIVLRYDSCSEAGISAQISFPGYAKSEVVKFVEWFFKTDYNFWNKAKTKYEPEQGDAGCYIEIKQAENVVRMYYVCGC